MKKAKALTIQRTLVPRSERDKYFERLRRKRDHYAAANCRFWVFEEASLPGAFIEFYEADEPEILVQAHAAAPDRILDSARVYLQTEIE
ncbi:MAG TPA: hypothetical protein VFO55_03505 [Gemmatimonadaceae bacterium]|nr:hypothetical protein [Gemmatimonadaceae bacterium]